MIGTDGNSVDNVGERNIFGASSSGNNAIEIIGGHDITIAGNYIGTDVTGTKSFSVGGPVVIAYDNATAIHIGTDGTGTAASAEGNLISGDTAYSEVEFYQDTNIIIAGNDIGTDVTGTCRVLGTASYGIDVDTSSGIQIGTNGDGVGDAAERNVIAGNWIPGGWSGFGVIAQNATDSVIAGNYIGVDASGTQAVGTGYAAVLLNFSSGICIFKLERTGAMWTLLPNGTSSPATGMWMSRLGRAATRSLPVTTSASMLPVLISLVPARMESMPIPPPEFKSEPTETVPMLWLSETWGPKRVVALASPWTIIRTPAK